MTEEDISVPTGRLARNSSLAEFEQALETLIVIAHSQGRNFLAYLLIMALMHVRRGRSGPHRSYPLRQAGGFRPDSSLFLVAL